MKCSTETRERLKARMLNLDQEDATRFLMESVPSGGSQTVTYHQPRLRGGGLTSDVACPGCQQRLFEERFTRTRPGGPEEVVWRLRCKGSKKATCGYIVDHVSSADGERVVVVREPDAAPERKAGSGQWKSPMVTCACGNSMNPRAKRCRACREAAEKAERDRLAVAEMERERVRVERAEAEAQALAARGGRRWSPQQREQLIACVEAGATVPEAAATLGIPVNTAFGWVQQYRAAQRWVVAEQRLEAGSRHVDRCVCGTVKTAVAKWCRTCANRRSGEERKRQAAQPPDGGDVRTDRVEPSVAKPVMDRLRSIYKQEPKPFAKAELAEHCGVSKALVGFWLHGDNLPGPENLKKIEAFLDGVQERQVAAQHAELFEPAQAPSDPVETVEGQGAPPTLHPQIERLKALLETTPRVLVRTTVANALGVAESDVAMWCDGALHPAGRTIEELERFLDDFERKGEEPPTSDPAPAISERNDGEMEIGGRAIAETLQRAFEEFPTRNPGAPSLRLILLERDPNPRLERNQRLMGCPELLEYFALPIREREALELLMTGEVAA